MMEEKQARPFSSRAFTAMGALFAGALLAFTGFFMEWGHGYTLAGLGKGQMKNLHWELGWLFTVFAAYHIALNWRPLLLHLRSRARQARPRLEWLLAFVLVGVMTWHSVASAPAGPPPGGPRMGDHGPEHDD